MKMHCIHLCVREREIDSLSIWQVCVHRNGKEKNETKQNKKEEKTKTKTEKRRITIIISMKGWRASEWVLTILEKPVRWSSQLTFCYVCLLNIISLIKSTHLLLPQKQKSVRRKLKLNIVLLRNIMDYWSKWKQSQTVTLIIL